MPRTRIASQKPPAPEISARVPGEITPHKTMSSSGPDAAIPASPHADAHNDCRNTAKPPPRNYRHQLDHISFKFPNGPWLQAHASRWNDERDVHAVMSLFALVQKHFRSRMDPLPLFGDDALQKLCMPVLTIVGSEDVLLDSSETWQRLERNVRHAQVRYLEGAGHGLPDQTAEILQFLCEREQEVPAQRGG